MDPTPPQPPTEDAHHQIVIVGAGAGGLAVASSLLTRDRTLDIALIDPARDHYYQPGWTMVGGGVFQPGDTRRDLAALIPQGARLIEGSVSAFDPEARSVLLADGRRIGYDRLVVAPGLTLDWDQIEGLAGALGQNGVTSNYRYDLAPYTWKLVREWQGGTALFTQPPMPIKCAGAPQKAMYLSCSHWLRSGLLDRTRVEFLNAGPVLFGVADYVPALMKYIERYGVTLSFGHTLRRVDGAGRRAWFETAGPDGEKRLVERSFDMLHVVPPQSAPAFIRNSTLANAAGWLDVDSASLRHVRHDDIYGVGDVIGAANAKTAAAARKQAPIVAENLLRDLGRMTGPHAAYDGYGSCPLTVEHGKVLLAEFGYGGKRLPSFPAWFINDLEPSAAAWTLKRRVLPGVYWNAMLKGREPMARPPRHRAG